MAYATPADVEARLGRELTAEETALVSTRLEDAELILKMRIPDLDQRIIDGLIIEAAVVMVESDMILRLIKNLDGYESENDGSYGYQLRVEVASGLLEVLPADWNRLGIRGGVYTIKPYVDIPTCVFPPSDWTAL